MKNFTKLVRFEFNRFFPIYAVLGIMTVVIQGMGVFVSANDYHQSIEKLIKNGITNERDIILQIGTMGMSNFSETLWFLAPIAFCITALLIYSLFIWYRDWLGKNTFIYRLLMLPTERLNIYFSKVVTIFLMVLGLLALQLILLFIENQLFSILIPETYFASATVGQVIQESRLLLLVYPSSFISFLAYYSNGFVSLLVLFTLVLFERSFKLKGLLFASIYGSFTLVLWLSPYWLQIVLKRQLFFFSEVFWISLTLTFIVGAISIWVSHRLLNKNITV